MHDKGQQERSSQRRVLALSLKHSSHCFIFFLPLDKKCEGTKQVKITGCIFPTGPPCATRAAEPDVLTPACLSYSAEVVYSEWGTRGHTAQGVCLCVPMYVCWGVKGEGGGTVSNTECLVMGYQKQSTGGQWDLGHSWHNPNTPGRKWMGGFIGVNGPSPREEERVPLLSPLALEMDWIETPCTERTPLNTYTHNHSFERRTTN